MDPKDKTESELAEDELDSVSGGTSGDEAGTLKGLAPKQEPLMGHEATHIVQGQSRIRPKSS